MSPLKNADGWRNVLANVCDRTSQSSVASRLRQLDGFPSPTVINQVLKGKYPGRTDRLQALVGGIYMNMVADCPVMGEIPLDQCDEYQNREFAATNPTRVRLYRMCRSGCPESRIKEESS